MINIKDTVSSVQLDTADTDNPDGVFQDYVAGVKPGTPILQSWQQTPYYTFRRIIFEGLGEEPNGDVDNYTDNQVYNALNALITSKIATDTTATKEALINQQSMFNISKYDLEKAIDVDTYTEDFDDIKFYSYKDLNDTIETDEVTCGTDIPISGDTWVACALNSTIKVAVTNGKIAYNNGSGWASNSITGDWQDVVYSEFLNAFIAVKENVVAYSSDGATWTEESVTGEWISLSSNESLELVIVLEATSAKYSADLSSWFSAGTYTSANKVVSVNEYSFIFDDDVIYKGSAYLTGIAFTSFLTNNYSSPSKVDINTKTNAIVASYAGAFGYVLSVIHPDIDYIINSITTSMRSFVIDGGTYGSGALKLYNNSGVIQKL